MTHPFQSFLDNPFQAVFGAQALGGLDICDPDLFSNASDGNMFCQASSSFTQQGPDGVQYAQSQSSLYGPAGVSSCLVPHSSVSSTSAISSTESMVSCRLLSTKGV